MDANEALAAVLALTATGEGYLSDVQYGAGHFTLTASLVRAAAPVTIRALTELPFRSRALALGLLQVWSVK